jgi:biopolymer transport protein ExbD
VNFYPRRRHMPQVIIVSLIDIFAILLIFVIVTTTFKTAQPE